GGPQRSRHRKCAIGRNAAFSSPGPSHRNGFKPPPERWKSTMEPPPISISTVAALLSNTTVRRPLMTVSADIAAVRRRIVYKVRTIRPEDFIQRIISQPQHRVEWKFASGRRYLFRELYGSLIPVFRRHLHEPQVLSPGRGSN